MECGINVCKESAVQSTAPTPLYDNGWVVSKDRAVFGFDASNLTDVDSTDGMDDRLEKSRMWFGWSHEAAPVDCRQSWPVSEFGLVCK